MKSTESGKCKACGRQLRSEKAIQLGYGPVCWTKKPSIQMAALEKAGQIRLPGVP